MAFGHSGIEPTLVLSVDSRVDTRVSTYHVVVVSYTRIRTRVLSVFTQLHGYHMYLVVVLCHPLEGTRVLPRVFTLLNKPLG